MRVLVVSREIPPVGGGAGAVALHLSRTLVQSGHEVHVLTMHFGDLPRRETIDGVVIERLRCGRRTQDSAYLGSMARFVVAARRRVKQLSASGAFDVVHAHAIVPDGAAAIAGHLPAVLTAHGTDVPGYDPHRYGRTHRLLAPLWRRVVRRAAVVTTPSEYLASLLAPWTSATVVPNGIELDLFPAESGDRSGFLIVSRLIERKGYHRFLEAMRHVPGSRRIDIVGDGPERARLEAIAAGLDHEVVFHGWLEHGSARWRDLYGRRRFFVFPSEAENFPVNLLEAQLAGLTVLATDIPGSREVLGDHAVYIDVADLTAEAIAATIRSVLERPMTENAALGAAAARRVRSRFGWDAIARRYLDVYGGAIDGA